MTAPTIRAARTRFARLYSDGSMGIVPAGLDYVAARKQLSDSHDDSDTELLEVEITVIRSHGRPKLRGVRPHSVICPTCAEIIAVEAPTDE